MKKTQLKELNGEIGKILGYYSFGAWTQLSPYMDSEQDPNITILHENTHRDLCFYTTAGHLQIILASLIRNNAEVHVSVFVKILEQINGGCWYTHEGAATFTSYLKLYPNFDTNINEIRGKLPHDYRLAFDIFLKAYKASCGISICKFSMSFVLFNIACAAMSGKHYLNHKSLDIDNVIDEEIIIDPTPDTILTRLVDFIVQHNVWPKIYNELRKVFNSLLQKEEFPNGAYLDFMRITSLDTLIITEAINLRLRGLFAEILYSLGVPTYHDGHDWHDERDSLVNKWTARYQRENIQLIIPVVFQRPGPDKHMNEQASSKNRLDLELGKEHKKSVMPSNYLKLNDLEIRFKEHFNVSDKLLLIDISRLPEHIVKNQRHNNLQLIFAALFKLHNENNYELIDYCASVGGEDALVDFLCNKSNVVPIIEPVAKKGIADAIIQLVKPPSICTLEQEFDFPQLDMLEHFINNTDIKFEIAFLGSRFHFIPFMNVSFLTNPTKHSIYYITEVSLAILFPELQKLSEKSEGRITLLMPEDMKTRPPLIGKYVSEYYAMKISRLDYDERRISELLNT